MIEAKPTPRFVVDPSRLCNIKCRFCYYLHKDLTSIYPIGQALDSIKAGKERGCDYYDVTGGEPTIYPYILKLLEYGNDLNLRCCIITNGTAGPKRTKEILDTGIHDWLISIHGMQQSHDWLVQKEGVRQKQIRFMDQVRNQMRFRINYVMTAYNQNEIVETAKWLNKWQPTIINFILFNPHHTWKTHKDSSKVVPDLNVIEQQLNEAIPILEENGTGANVRYYPMCKIAPEYRRCVCSDLHVIFDNREWDYDEMPKTFDHYRQWGVKLSRKTENHTDPCNRCQLEWICGGLNKFFYNICGRKYLEPVNDVNITDVNDFYHYRKHNVMTLGEVV